MCSCYYRLLFVGYWEGSVPDSRYLSKLGQGVVGRDVGRTNEKLVVPWIELVIRVAEVTNDLVKSHTE